VQMKTNFNRNICVCRECEQIYMKFFKSTFMRICPRDRLHIQHPMYTHIWHCLYTFGNPILLDSVSCMFSLMLMNVVVVNMNFVH